MFEKYRLNCTHPGCNGRMIVEQAVSAGLRLGDLVPGDSANPSYGRCPKCHRYMMKVTYTTPPQQPLPPEGFSKIPKT